MLPQRVWMRETPLPSVSVIVPAWNAAATIERTLRSIADQTLSPDEIIVVDDGSTDATADIVRSWGDRDPRFKLMRQSNQGPVAARNAAIAYSAGALLAPVDADDIWRPEYLERMTAALERDPAAGFVYCLYRGIDEDDRALQDGGDFGCEGRVLLQHLLVNFVGNGSCAVFRREALLAAGGFDPEAETWGGAEDYLLQLRIAATARVARVGDRLVGYRRSTGSYSARAPSRNLRARLAAIDRVMAESSVAEPGIRRLATADALRTTAARLAISGRWIQALGYGLRAFGRDAPGILQDLRIRIDNALGRLRPSQREGLGMSFLDLDPSVSVGPPVDPLTLRRLARLQAREPG